MARTHVWAQPYKTSGWTGYWGQPGVKTNDIPMPTMNYNDTNSQRPIAIYGIARGYASGVSPIWQGIYYRGVETQGSRWFDQSGGVFAFFIRGGAGTMYFGRDEGAGRIVIDENDGGTWGGTLAGQLDYAGVPSYPSISAVLQSNKRGVTVTIGASGDDGGSSLTEYRTQYSFDGSAWGGDRVNAGYVINFDNLIMGATYRFRTSSANGVGRSQWNYSGYITIPLIGGRRYSGSAFDSVLNAKRYTGTAWVDLVTRKRYTGSAWTDIVN